MKHLTHYCAQIQLGIITLVVSMVILKEHYQCLSSSLRDTNSEGSVIGIGIHPFLGLESRAAPCPPLQVVFGTHLWFVNPPS